MASNNNIPTSIDYTSRDFYSLRNDLISRVKLNINQSGKQWNGSDPTDFGVALIEAFAHVGDIANYYIDRVANESFMATASRRQSVLNLATLYGYTPYGFSASSVVLTFSNTTSSDVTIPAGTVFVTSISLSTQQNQVSVDVVFTLSEDVQVLAGEATTGLASHGRDASSLPENFADENDSTDIAGELLGYSTGYANQSFTLAVPQVVDGSVSISVKSGNQFIQWNRVNSISEFGPTDAVYQLTMDEANYVTVTFGDGVSGAIPTYGDTIKANYTIGGGVEGNINSGNVFHAVFVPPTSGVSLSDISGVSVFNDSGNEGYGGNDPESTESIRTNAPLSFKTVSRAVSLEDFSGLALAVGGVGKSAAYKQGISSVSLYVAPTLDAASTDYYPGYAANNQTLLDSWRALQESVYSFFSGKMFIGANLTVLPPAYVPVDMIIEYVSDSGYTDDQVASQLLYGLVFDEGYNARSFDEVIRPEKMEKLISNFSGVDTAKLLKFARHSGSGINTLVGAQGEIFTFVADYITAYPVAALKSMALSHGSITFKPTTYSYSVTVGSGDSSITVTPTVARDLVGSASTVTVNGVSVTSGSASSSIPLASGADTEILVEVTSYDLAHTKTYKIVVTRPA